MSLNEERRIDGLLCPVPGGGYAIVRPDLPEAVYAQRYAADGQPLGGVVRIAPSEIAGGSVIGITVLADAGYLFTWVGPSPNPWLRWDSDYPLVFQRYAADGALLAAGQVAVTQPGALRVFLPSKPRTAVLPDGGFVLAWAQYDDIDFNTQVRRYAADGTPAGPAQQVGSGGAGLGLVALSNGGYLVTSANHAGMYARAYAADGAAVGPAQVFGSPLSPVLAELPAVTALADGGALVTWVDQTFGTHVYARVYARRLAPDARVVGDAFVVDGATTPGQEAQTQSAPGAAGLDDGGYVVVWRANGDVYGRRFAAQGSALGGAVRLNLATSAAQEPSVVATGSGGFAVTWSAIDSNAVRSTYARFFDASGLRTAS